MNAQMVEKASFLLRDAHVPRQEAVHALAEYFPGSAFEDRVRCVSEAWDIAHHGMLEQGSVSSELADARYFAAAHARHGFTD